MKIPTPTRPLATRTTAVSVADQATTLICGSNPGSMWALMGVAIGQIISAAMKPIANATTISVKRKE